MMRLVNKKDFVSITSIALVTFALSILSLIIGCDSDKKNPVGITENNRQEYISIITKDQIKQRVASVYSAMNIRPDSVLSAKATLRKVALNGCPYGMLPGYNSGAIQACHTGIAAAWTFKHPAPLGLCLPLCFDFLLKQGANKLCDICFNGLENLNNENRTLYKLYTTYPPGESRTFYCNAGATCIAELKGLPDMQIPDEIIIAAPTCKFPIPGDTNCDGLVSDFELLDYINKWEAGDVDYFDLLKAIEIWNYTSHLVSP